MLFPFSSDIMLIYFSFQFEAVSDWDSVRREVDAASRSVRQLGSLLFEMEVLRSYLEQQDLPYFDQRVEPAKKQALLAIRQLQGETMSNQSVLGGILPTKNQVSSVDPNEVVPYYRY